jgi:para-nitrobenzyl esterase
MFPEEAKPYRDGLSKSMMSYWANMAYTGNPGRGRDGKEVQWMPWENGKGKPKMMIFDTSRDGGIRMSDFEITPENFKAEFMADTSFEDQDILCETYAATFSRTGLFDREEYRNLGADGCGDYPLE